MISSPHDPALEWKTSHPKRKRDMSGASLKYSHAFLIMKGLTPNIFSGGQHTWNCQKSGIIFICWCHKIYLKLPSTYIAPMCPSHIYITGLSIWVAKCAIAFQNCQNRFFIPTEEPGNEKLWHQPQNSIQHCHVLRKPLCLQLTFSLNIRYSMRSILIFY